MVVFVHNFLASTFVFGFAAITSYWTLVIARGIQGVGSAPTFTAGMSMLAALYKTDDERGKQMGTAMGGSGLAVLIGPPLGNNRQNK
jgi:MFS family permease